MGSSENSIIQLKQNLTKKKGDAITIPLVGALDDSSGPNDGSSDLVGNEKALPNDGHQITVGVVRDAVVVNSEEEQKSPIDIRNAGKSALKTLAMRYMRNDIITALGSKNGTAYGSVSEANKDAWLVDNADRVLFGDAKSNNAGNDHSAALAAVTSSMTLDGDIVSLHKRMVQTCDNVNGDGIRPYTYGEDMESFVMFVPSMAFRDLRSWMVSNGYWENAMQRAKSNPLFSGPTSIEWDGVIVREIPEIGVLSGVGATGNDVAPCYLCGAQALGIAWAQRTKSTIRKEDDYGFKHGVGFHEMRGIEKLQYGQTGSDAKDWGMGTLYVAGVADA